MSTGDLVEILELWRSALRELDATVIGSPERAAAEARAEQRRLEYRAAALRLDARMDEVEEALEATRLRPIAPLVTTTGSAMEEVAGDAAVLVPPGERRALAAALDRVLRNDPEQLARRARGLDRAAAATWDAAAEGHVAAYRVARDSRR